MSTDLIAALPEMEPSAEERADPHIISFAVGHFIRADTTAIELQNQAYRDGQSSVQPRLVELEAEMARLAQDRDRYKAWCDAETHHIAAVRRELAEVVAALAAVQPLIEAARAFVETTEQKPGNPVATPGTMIP